MRRRPELLPWNEAWQALQISMVLLLMLYAGVMIAAGRRQATPRRMVVCEYVVQPGDTLWSVWTKATGQQVNWQAWLLDARRRNPGLRCSRLHAGSVLLIEAAENRKSIAAESRLLAEAEGR